MTTYAAETDIEAMIGYSIDANSKPSSTELALMLSNADRIINAEMRVGSNVVDTYNILVPIECNLVFKMINNQMAFVNPSQYYMMKIQLEPEDIRVIHTYFGAWSALSFEAS